ncbi:MAG: diaminopimelate epimerase [Bacteroides sp.]|nr:diaminopimelate epimerase [Bacteroides sp.]
MNELRFTKMHGIGNDYIYFTEMPCAPEKLPELSRRLSDRHRSVGGDGIILVLPSEKADFQMRIFNADGSEARMCGNGSRCVGKLVYDKHLTTKLELTLETLSGIKHLRLHPGRDGRIESVTVNMGKVSVQPAVELETSAGPMSVIPVDMGNPHGVVFIEGDPDQFDVHGIGAELEHNPYWADRANIEFVQVKGSGCLKMRVWERGSGETMACGTGACAVASAAWFAGYCGSESRVSLPGGDLEIKILPDLTVLMTGGATTAFHGRVELEI